MAHVCKAKKIIDIQIKYIWNRVIVLAIKYKLNLTVLSHAKYNKINAPSGLIKNKAQLARTAFNISLMGFKLYNITFIWNTQLQFHTKSLKKLLPQENTLNLFQLSTLITKSKVPFKIASTNNVVNIMKH